MSDAFCISASSAGDLIIRQPRTTGAALRRSSRGSAPCEARRRRRSAPSPRSRPAPASLRSRSEAGDQRQRILILLPGADLGGDAQALADRRLLEEGRDDDRLAVGRDEGGGQALAAAPLHAGEIIELAPGSTGSRRGRARISCRALAIRAGAARRWPIGATSPVIGGAWRVRGRAGGRTVSARAGGERAEREIAAASSGIGIGSPLLERRAVSGPGVERSSQSIRCGRLSSSPARWRRPRAGSSS
jgi:hypothetical protein